MTRIAATLISVLFAASADAGAPQRKPPVPESPRADAGTDRQVKNRVISFSDENRASVPELHLAQGVPTTLVFPLNINEATTRLADSQRLIYKPQFFKNTAVLSPKSDLPTGALIPLTVGLEDGTLLSFVLRTVPAEADFQVTVEVKFQREVSPDSVEGLKQTIAQMQSRLDECQANAGSSGVSQIAALVLSQEPQSPTARTFEGHPLKGADKQSRLLVRLQHIYRLFGHSYVLLTVENRDPSRTWVLDKPEVKLIGGRESQSLKVLTFDTDLKNLPPAEVAKVVVVFDTPTQSVGQKYALTLLEKGGARHVSMNFEP
jgi:uncharacterized protein (TIGR02268 family)